MLGGAIDVLLLDIEGTITSISFVKETLFPFARSNLVSYLNANWGSDELNQDIQSIREEVKRQVEAGDNNLVEIPNSGSSSEVVLDGVIKAVYRWMDQDKKVGALKQLQGHIWQEAYKSGQIKGHLYPDVVPALQNIAESSKIKVFIYSSGSVSAQKLLLGHSIEGDVTPMLSGYFDTAVGMKIEPTSYTNIANEIGVERSRILFCTDIEKEAFAAKSVGMNCVLFVRPGNAALSSQAKTEFRVLRSMDELLKLHF